jgi:hypothetical protein
VEKRLIACRLPVDVESATGRAADADQADVDNCHVIDKRSTGGEQVLNIIWSAGIHSRFQGRISFFDDAEPCHEVEKNQERE